MLFIKSNLHRQQTPAACLWFVFILFFLQPLISASVPNPPEGFALLFNGVDLTGWRGGSTYDHREWFDLPEIERARLEAEWTADMHAHWRVEDGELVNDGEGKFATTVSDYSDFELLLEYKTERRADSGIYLRGVPQVQIWDYTDPAKFDRGANRGSGGLYNNPEADPGRYPRILADKPFGQWNAMRILMVGEHVTVWLNGKLVVDQAKLFNFHDRKRPSEAQRPIPERGPIQLQTHGGEIRWRNLFIREIIRDEIPYQHKTEIPLTYMRDYSGGHLDDEAFFQTIEANPPELLVLGKDAPLHHNWGPVAGTGGENQRFGQGEHIRRLSPAELHRKIGKIRAMVNRLHAAGVRWVMPYICTMTIGGRDDHRTGFWEFYDHWEEYEKAFGLGPRPKDDPRDWMQQRSDGSLQTYYEWTPDYYAPNRRWAACIHHPSWKQHLSNVVRLAAEAGYDGVYMDNNRSVRCFCPYCQTAFREYLADRFSPEEIRRTFPSESLEAIRLYPDADPFHLAALNTSDTPPSDTPLIPGEDLYLVKLAWEFWTDTKVDFLKDLKAVGTSAGRGEFHIFANTTAYIKGAYEPSRVSAVASFNQSEENGGRTGAHPGLVDLPGQPPVINRRAFEFKFNQAVANGMRVGMLTRAGHGLPSAVAQSIDQNPQTAFLSIAESAAFAGGGGIRIIPEWDAQGAIRTWRHFFQEYGHLYQGTEVWAPIGVIAFGEQFFNGLDKAHIVALRAIGKGFAENGVLFDLIHEANFSLERLRRYRAVLVPPGVRGLSLPQWELFQQFAKENPGRLFIMGDDFGTLDETGLQRALADFPSPFVSLPAHGGVQNIIQNMSHALGHTAHSLSDPEGSLPPGVGINAFALSDAERPAHLMVHLINYNVPLGKKREDPPLPVENLEVTLPLPSNWIAQSITAFSPNPGENLHIPFEQQEDLLRLRVPRLEYYQVIRITGHPVSP